MYTVGGIPNRSQFSADTTLQSIIIKMLGDINQRPVDSSTPNTRYKSQNLGIWSNIGDVDNFLNACDHDTGYHGATIGSYVTIMDGTYNKQWIIAGFDMEHNRTAADGTVYDNGYGICLIPKTSLVGNAAWGSDTANGYNGSIINKTTLPAVATNLKGVLGSHLVLRNVLLSSARDNGYWASAYTWTTAYCTLMSMGQVTGTFASNYNKYDDGEANYKLPLFNYKTWSFDNVAWLRGLYGFDGYHGPGTDYVYSLTTSGGSDYGSCYNKKGLCPLIYIR